MIPLFAYWSAALFFYDMMKTGLPSATLASIMPQMFYFYLPYSEYISCEGNLYGNRHMLFSLELAPLDTTILAKGQSGGSLV